MARQTAPEGAFAYPQLTPEQVDGIITALIACRQAGSMVELPCDSEQLLRYLVGFYTKRWGLPSALARRRDGGDRIGD